MAKRRPSARRVRRPVKKRKTVRRKRKKTVTRVGARAAAAVKRDLIALLRKIQAYRRRVRRRSRR